MEMLKVLLVNILAGVLLPGDIVHWDGKMTLQDRFHGSSDKALCKAHKSKALAL